MSRCVAILGGSFDPVHNGHVSLGVYFAKLLRPDELRIVPAGNPWQKTGLIATPEQRIEMLRRAFAAQHIPITVDRQEIERHGPTYTIDTLRALRTEFGEKTSIALLIGADQLRQLDTWRNWLQLFDYAHICTASRPGFTGDLPPAIAQEISARAATPEQIRKTPHGMTFIADDLAINVSASDARAALKRGERPVSLLPPVVLDYIDQFHIYKD